MRRFGHALNAFDYFDNKAVQARQVVPDADHWTLDIPDASSVWSPKVEPVWESLDDRWNRPFDPAAMAVTNLAAIRGERITEAARWAPDQWELFAGAGPDVQQNDIRVVPLSTMFALDSTLLPVVQLNIGSALWRKAGDKDWQPWGDTKRDP